MPIVNPDLIEGDALFALMARYKADTHQNKCDLGVGAYRTNEGQPWVLPVVRKIDIAMANDPKVNHEYLPIGGNKEFSKAAAKLILGDSVSVDKVASVQTISGTGANHMAAKFLATFGTFGTQSKTIWVSDPTWANHHGIFEYAGLSPKKYPYWDSKSRSLNINGLLDTLKTAQKGDSVLLHACAHNPTGVDPTRDQWKQILEVVKQRQLFVVFDSAYQGFASGDLDNDAWAVRHFVEHKVPLVVCQSFSKNLGLYGERAGAVHFVDPEATKESVAAVVSQLERQTRAEFSNPPGYGARIAQRVLTVPEYYDEWKQNIKTMADRIITMRKELRKALEDLNTPGSWEHITNQIGMFSFTGLGPDQVKRLVNEYHIYLAGNGRISMAGLTSANVKYIAQSINTVLREKSNL